MPNYSLLSVVIAIALIFSAAESLPFAFAHEHTKGGGQSSPGRLNEKTQSFQRSQGGTVTNTSENSCICEHDGPPEDVLKELKKEVLHRPHPMFLLSEMAENLHRQMHCHSKCLGFISSQTEEEIPGRVKNTILNYLNGAVDSTVPCPTRFNITYYPKRYPRYLVEVVCTDEEDKPRRCTLCSAEGGRIVGNSPRCFPYDFGGKYMYYLTNDSEDSGHNSDTSSWHIRIRSVPVGCTCKN